MCTCLTEHPLSSNCDSLSSFLAQRGRVSQLVRHLLNGCPICCVAMLDLTDPKAEASYDRVVEIALGRISLQ
jgi:hypothetical protein